MHGQPDSKARRTAGFAPAVLLGVGPRCVRRAMTHQRIPEPLEPGASRGTDGGRRVPLRQSLDGPSTDTLSDARRSLRPTFAGNASSAVCTSEDRSS